MPDALIHCINLRLSFLRKEKGWGWGVVWSAPRINKYVFFAACQLILSKTTATTKHDAVSYFHIHLYLNVLGLSGIF